jgi:hypothetical protein
MKNKSILFLLLAFAGMLSIMFMSSCSKEEVKDDKEDDKTTEQPQKVDNYYVKYEVKTVKQVYIEDKKITYKDVDEEKKITGPDWNGTYGPFKKGDNVYLYVSINNTLNRLSARISVSKNQEPFTIKAESMQTGSINLEYTIDF